MKRLSPLLLALALFLPAQAWAACEFVNVGALAEAASGNLTQSAPATPASGDVWVSVVASNDLVPHTFTDWTPIHVATSGGGNLSFSTWIFPYAGSAPNLIVGHTAGGGIVGGIAAFRGCKSTVDTEGTATDQANDNTPTFAAITPTVANTIVLAAWGYNDNLLITTGPTDFTQAFLYRGATTTAMGAYLYYKAHAGGDTGTIGATMTAMGNDDEGISLLIALAPQTGSTSGMLTGVGK